MIKNDDDKNKLSIKKDATFSSNDISPIKEKQPKNSSSKTQRKSMSKVQRDDKIMSLTNLAEIFQGIKSQQRHKTAKRRRLDGFIHDKVKSRYMQDVYKT